ncbi:MAG TPA: DUF2180 family protein [Solirubrobacteraceae bacterium]
MNCYVCDGKGETTPAVGLCRSCSVALCAEHLAVAARDLDSRMYATCAHDIKHPRAA